MKNRNLRLNGMAILLLILVLVNISCNDTNSLKNAGNDEEFKVEMINCDGTVAREWISNGKPKSEPNSDGYFFNNKETGKLIEVTGRIVITKQ